LTTTQEWLGIGGYSKDRSLLVGGAPVYPGAFVFTIQRENGWVTYLALIARDNMEAAKALCAGQLSFKPQMETVTITGWPAFLEGGNNASHMTSSANPLWIL